MTEESRSFSQRKALSAYVNSRVLSLQSRYLQRESSALAQLARIRHSEGGLGSWSLFDILETQIPNNKSAQVGWDADLLGEPSETNLSFIAAVSTLELFATRIQSETSAVADVDWQHSFGAACRMIGSKNGEPVDIDNFKGVIRRLAQLESAQDFTSVKGILRRLTHLMRKQQYCVLDFGRLAVDLQRIQSNNAQHVFFDWAKDFYRTGAFSSKTIDQKTSDKNKR